MAIAKWGPWQNADTVQGMARYEEMDLQISTPEQVAQLDEASLEKIARDCGALLQCIYKGEYPLSTGDAEQLVESVRKDTTHLFTLTAEDSLVAMAAIVDQPNKVGGEVRMSELGRAGSTTTPDGRPISSRALLTNRVPWTEDHLPYTDFLYSYTRAASEERHGIPSGKGVQSVWWGGRAHGGQSPLITSNVGWYYDLGKPEPFNGFVMPTKSREWANAAETQPLYVATEQDKYTLDTLIVEGTNENVNPATFVDPDNKATDVGFVSTQPFSSKIATNYVITHKGDAERYDTETVNEQLSESFAQRAVIEADIATTKEGARVMHELHREGWTLIGWEPSSLEYGARAPVMSRVSPRYANQLVQPLQHPEYFDRSGLTKTRLILDGIYAALHSKASQ